MITYEHEVRAAIAGGVQDGLVDPNLVRPLIPDFVPSKTVGQVYRKLRQDGTLIEFDHVRSNDVRGRNVGKLVPRYKVAKPIIVPKPAPPKPPKQTTLGPCAICRTPIERYGDYGQPLCEWCQP